MSIQSLLCRSWCTQRVAFTPPRTRTSFCKRCRPTRRGRGISAWLGRKMCYLRGRGGDFLREWVTEVRIVSFTAAIIMHARVCACAHASECPIFCSKSIRVRRFTDIRTVDASEALIRCVPGEDRTNGFFVSCFVKRTGSRDDWHGGTKENGGSSGPNTAKRPHLDDGNAERSDSKRLPTGIEDKLVDQRKKKKRKH